MRECYRHKEVRRIALDFEVKTVGNRSSGESASMKVGNPMESECTTIGITDDHSSIALGSIEVPRVGHSD